MTRENILILGSTGSVGTSALEVISLNADRYRVYALVAHQNHVKLLEQIDNFSPEVVVLTDLAAAMILRDRLGEKGISECRILFEDSAVVDLCNDREVSTVIAAISGTEGVESVFASLRAGKKILLANKESLILGGKTLMDLADKHDASIIPIDSEHNAINQCLGELSAKELPGEVNKIYLTASGGPFLHDNTAKVAHRKPEEALRHPNWSMGMKNSIDSATMANKAFEVIEACILFRFPLERISVLIHEQSIIHGMIEYVDGSYLAMLSVPDMKASISYGLGCGERIKSGVAFIDFQKNRNLTFSDVDEERFSCFAFILQKYHENSLYGIILNAANEVAVYAYLAGKIIFGDIIRVLKFTYEEFDTQGICDSDNFDELVNLNNLAKKAALTVVEKINMVNE